MSDPWLAIEAAARDQCRAELDMAERTPLEFGQPIAWVEYQFARTDEFTEVHRVGLPIEGKQYTTCHVVIPAAVAWVPLNPRLMQSLGPCGHCEAASHRAKSAHAA